MTVAEAYAAGVQNLVRSGFDAHEARLMARLLVDRAAGASHAHLTRPDAILDDQTAFLPHGFFELERGRPLAYVLGECEFFGLPFRCDESALIPRPETETLVEAAIERLKDRDRVLVVDIGTGSGCIAVSLAHALPQAVIHATDVSGGALGLARLNAERNGVAERIKFIEGEANNWAEPLLREGFEGCYDAVLSNPPYIAARDIETLQPQIRDWEPRLALDGGEDGLKCYRHIAAQCGALLKPGGFLMCELGAGQFEAVRALFEYSTAYSVWQVEPPLFDLAGIARVLVATIGAMNRA